MSMNKRQIKGVIRMKRAAVLGLCFLSTSILAGELPSRSPQGLVATGYFFPSAANAQGLFAGAFKTRMVLTNPSSTPTVITASLNTDKGSGGIKTITLGAAETLVYENFLQDVFAFSGNGGFSLVENTGSKPFYAAGEVYADGPNGRFSTALVAMSPDDRVLNVAMRETGTSLSAGMRVNALNRANFGCTNMDGTLVVIRADIYNETTPALGYPAAQVTLNVPGSGWAQSPVLVSGEKIRILFFQLSAGGLYGSYCFGVNVNNQSNDGLLIPALYAPQVD
jgi:hypothetical protein